MAADAAATSLKITIERILDSSRILLAPHSSEIIKPVCREMKSLKKTLKRLDRCSRCKSRKKVNGLDGRIKEVVWKFEDLLESLLSHQILSQFEISRDERDVMVCSIDLHDLRGDVDSFIQTMKDMEEEYIHELDNMPEVEEDECASSRYEFCGMKTKMVGFSYYFTGTKIHLMEESNENYVCSFVGMAGIGKTTLANEIFKDPEILRWFDHCAWVTVGRKSQFNEIARCIVAQVDPSVKKITEDDEKIGEYLKERLDGKKCLIVLDDVWDTEILDHLTSSLPDENSGTIRILLTTTVISVADHLSQSLGSGCSQQIRPLNEEESLDLLREKVFGEEVFPPQIEKAAKKIAKNCDGLPLMIVTVGEHLSNAKNEPEYWNEVANKRSSVFMDAYNEISKVLFLTYDCFCQYFKMFYLYMGSFPQDYEISISKLTNMVSVEGFLEVHTWEYFFNESLYEVGMWSGIVTISENSMRIWAVKTCRLYTFWRHLFNRESSKHKFLHVLNIGIDGLEEVINGQRRLCLHSNNLFDLRKVHSSIKHGCASTARSLLCFGPYHKYSMPLDVGFKLLRVLDALKVRFYSFPVEILELVLLQYLALTYNGELPSFISKLLNLQFLIIHPHLGIKYRGVSSYVPVQIWDMLELKLIEILGSNLPNPKAAASLQKLSTLLGVSSDTCTREVLQKLPNIRKLGIRVELTPHDDGNNPLSCFDHIAELKNLETLKCSVVNPEVMIGYVAHLPPLSMFPSSLRKLHLSGMGYPWKYMKVIGSLPNLVVLKLRCYAFQGPKWEIKQASFLHLEYLLIEDTDLVQWKPRQGSFLRLCTLRIKHCYKLEELQWPSDCESGRIELVDSNPLAVTCANQLKTKKHKSLRVIASFDYGDRKSNDESEVST